MLEDCTAIVTATPNRRAIAPPPRLRTAFKERSTWSATSDRMFFVTSVSAARTITNPDKTMSTPCTLPDAPTASQKSLIQDTGSLTQAFTGLFHSVPADPTSCSLNHSAGRLITPNNNSAGSRMTTASTLKKSCTVAAANARRNSFE